jgi:hypothetical protein
MDCRGAGRSRFGSWNNGDVELGSQSFSNVIIGANGSGANARTTTIRGKIIVTGDGGTAATLWGGTKFQSSASNFTVGSTININNYLFIATGTLSGQTLTIPSYIDGQILYIRNNKLSSTLVVTAQSGQTIFLRNGGFASTFTMAALTYIQIMGTAVSWYIL